MKSPLLSYEDALNALLDAANVLAGDETVALMEAAGRVLANDLHSTLAVPPQDNSAMDGYALRANDVPAAGTRLPVSQRIPAGANGQPLTPGSAARIFTGAPIPAGADAVVMQEHSRQDGDHVLIDELPRTGQNIRRRGEDIAADALVLPGGTRLGGAEIGLAASVGAASVSVRRRLKVACFFTGDELREPGTPLPPGAIYNSNRYMLATLLRQAGCDVTDLGIVRDDLGATREALRLASSEHDLVLTSGGVSVGEEDHVKAAVETEGRLALWKIAIKPGKPLAFGTVGQADFIGLPGNPVSAFVTYVMLVLPYLRKRQGLRDARLRERLVTAGFEWKRPESRREFLRARVNESGCAMLYEKQGSAVLTSCAWADGLVVVPPGETIALGSLIRFINLQEVL
ncbi:molybdopterin molybdotransferase MoeA [Niveibacterium umoris]|uniref:Molybdopterin molybdenumtransferase n=1 Tax=Niveibacterium umoris TaxID=1193620 RepID=A0A840BIR4_9RHOO|nr:gephyrin-like molybdotransferase Glp [Niveibacterium umoris]MBB4011479.1 molybdopterin molybdotransferase [Niveibacterium umoris]